MRRRNFFGSHLYSQIVAPLLVASIVVGVIATLVAVYFLRDLTDTWVAQMAESTTSNLAFRYEQQADQMRRVTAFGAEELRGVLGEGDPEAITEGIRRENAALEFDAMLVLDEDGRAIASVGTPVVPVGQRAFAMDDVPALPNTTLAELGAQPALVTTHPVREGGRTYTVVSAYAVDNAFLAGLGVGDGSAFCLYTVDGVMAAHSIGGGFSAAQRGSLSAALEEPSAAVAAVLGDIESQRAGRGSLWVGEDGYQLWATPLRIAGDERGITGYLVGAVSQSVSQQAGTTTTNLIAMWSIIAVVALVGLGGWVARRVSDPLVELAQVAQRIADGDFTTKVKVGGANEIAQLADSFNAMTDSLHERSESLTKKVLELATLYEMSRALGSTLEMEQLLGSVLESALRIFDLDLGYVALRDKETGALQMRAIRGDGGSDGQGAVRSSMSEWVVREGRPLIFNPEAGTASRKVDTVTGAKAALCVPLISAEGAIGSITIGSSDPEYRFNSEDVRLLSTIANHVTIAIGNIELFSSLQEAYLATVRSLAAAVDAKDTYTRGHSDRVATYAVSIAERLGLPHEQRIALEMAAYLHDIGKIGVPEEILLKPGRLDAAEMAQMRHHPLIGANILKPVAFPWAITPIVRHHHEHFDGSGYPAGLAGDEIPLLARILTVADSFEAMTADRPYRTGMAPLDAIEELRRCSAKQFDPMVVDVFAELLIELDAEDASLIPQAAEEIAPEEARAVFAALVDGLFMSFRKLGGPRLSSNVEREVDQMFAAEEMPFRIERGRLVFRSDPPRVIDGEIEQMRAALKRIDTVMGRLSGTTLVEHFYTDALEAFSARMRERARELAFYTAA